MASDENECILCVCDLNLRLDEIIIEFVDHFEVLFIKEMNILSIP